jgi:hypothetical protein
MLVERRSEISGKISTMEIDVTPEELKAWENGNMLIQVAFPNLSVDAREFIKTGITTAEWNDLFSGCDEE